MWTQYGRRWPLAALALCAAPAAAQVVRLEITSREPMNNGPGRPARAGPVRDDPRHGSTARSIRRIRTTRSSRISISRRATRAARSSTSRRSRWPSRSIWRRRRACSSTRSSTAGNGQAVASPEGYISLVSGWQGDVIPTANNQTIVVPIARQPDGSPVTGPVIARFFDVADGATTARRSASPRSARAQPYPPVDLAQPTATLTWHTPRELRRRSRTRRSTVPRADWAFANCETTPWPGTPDPTRICLKDGFRADRLYELVYTAKDPLVLGVGLAATRDIVVVLPPRQRRTPPARRIRSPARSTTRSASATRSRATSSGPSSISASTRTRRTASSGTARSRASRRGRRRSTCGSRCRAAPPASTSRAATASSGGRATRTRRAG